MLSREMELTEDELTTFRAFERAYDLYIVGPAIMLPIATLGISFACLLNWKEVLTGISHLVRFLATHPRLG